MWHMPADTTETMAEHSTRLHAPVTAFMFSCSGTDVLPYRMTPSVRHAAIEVHYYYYYYPKWMKTRVSPVQ